MEGVTQKDWWLGEETETGHRGYRHGRDGDERGDVGAPNAKAKGLS